MMFFSVSFFLFVHLGTACLRSFPGGGFFVDVPKPKHRRALSFTPASTTSATATTVSTTTTTTPTPMTTTMTTTTTTTTPMSNSGIFVSNSIGQEWFEKPIDNAMVTDRYSKIKPIALQKRQLDPITGFGPGTWPKNIYGGRQANLFQDVG
uniref:COesterase domain-containing protein n=1 Tax=Steinernema glaseri TaxID=37863 RepID=A0A1I7ZJA1_9BILA